MRMCPFADVTDHILLTSAGVASCERGTCTTSCSNANLEYVAGGLTARVRCTCMPRPTKAPGGRGDPRFEGPEGINYYFHGEQVTEDGRFKGTRMDSFFFIYTSEDGRTEHTVHVALADRPDASLASNLTIAFDSEPILSHELAGSGDDTWRTSDGSCVLERLMTSAARDGVRVNISGVVEMEIKAVKHTGSFPDGLHLDFAINNLRMTPSVHGVLGQMFQSGKPQQFEALAGHVGKNGKGIVDGTYPDYQTSDLTSPDCKFAQYVRTFEAPGTDQPGSRDAAVSRKMLSADAQTLSVSGFACRHAADGELVCAGV
ncbi:hypothetical protein KFL_001950060 [Klebsormidium nitens]|uniref:Root cap family protein n=1 Tax=Klebsormidium nitens TaxID=105231 RepID=A0A1Y1I271_KLENI|nr:hypothetical protein KFL_001950060 [Klebsormidium nitens]|eukprot:GAQ84573.1 hypothetical protein KFL_001950060 [Klebsormidium nitens]